MAIKTRNLRSAAARSGSVVVAKSLSEALSKSKQTAFLCHWCPWEIGCADSIKGYEKILIIPTEDDFGNWYGNEYLQLYKKIDEGTDRKTGRSGYAAFGAGANSGTWIRNL